jgi:transcriptional regulator with XRE-family HTH domain
VVAQRIYAFRKAAGLSQTELGDRIGVTFQQVQKYETGVNRVGAGRLSAIAQALSVPITALFDGVAQPTKRPSKEASLDELMQEPRARKLLEAFRRIPDPLQIEVLQFVRGVRTAEKRRSRR